MENIGTLTVDKGQTANKQQSWDSNPGAFDSLLLTLHPQDLPTSLEASPCFFPTQPCDFRSEYAKKSIIASS